MCKFFSLVSDGRGKIMYLNWEQRQTICKEKYYDPDSHTSIADHHGYIGKQEDLLNKYEYNPLLKIFRMDQLNTIDDSTIVNQKCLELDFKKIVKPLIIKKIIHPFKDLDKKRVFKKDIELLREYASTEDGTWCLAWYSLRSSVTSSVWELVRDSITNSVRGSIANSVRGSVVNLVRGSVIRSINDLITNYMFSFFDIKRNFIIGAQLWERGLVPCFNGKKWYLIGGRKPKILYKEA